MNPTPSRKHRMRIIYDDDPYATIHHVTLRQSSWRRFRW